MRIAVVEVALGNLDSKSRCEVTGVRSPQMKAWTWLGRLSVVGHTADNDKPRSASMIHTGQGNAGSLLLNSDELRVRKAQSFHKLGVSDELVA